MLSSFRPGLSILLAAALLAPASLAFDIPLSDEAIRQAYFLGQRRDEKTAQFFEKYNRRLDPPESGPYISDIAFFTPYANAVELSRQNSLGYSAQDALQVYKKHGDIVSVVNSQSKRTVHGTVSGPGRVTVGSTVPRMAAAGLPSVATETRGPERRRTE